MSRVGYTVWRLYDLIIPGFFWLICPGADVIILDSGKGLLRVCLTLDVVLVIHEQTILAYKIAYRSSRTDLDAVS